MSATHMAVLSLDTRKTGGFGVVKSGWGHGVGQLYPMPSLGPETRTDFRVKMDAVRLHDVVYNSIQAVTAMRTTGFATTKDLVRVWIVHRGGWLLRDDRGVEQNVAAGQLLVHRGPIQYFSAQPTSDTTFLVVPAQHLGMLKVPALGAASSPEARLLAAHATMIRDYASELSPAGVQGARNTLLELIRAVVFGGVDGTEGQIAPVLVHAARKLAEQWLAHPGLSASALAQELNVSVRTLQRAFAAEGQTMALYLRDRRLEQARSDLAQSWNPLSVSEIAARWQFADASHFARQFKRRYGMTPSELRRGSLAGD